jgi:SMC interacting uncharacterized protein involved in chromosome segregation
VASGKSEGKVEVVEQTPTRTTITIWDGRATKLLNTFLQIPSLDRKSRARLEGIVKQRQEIGRIDTEIEGLKEQERELDKRARQTRENIKAIRKDKRAVELRARLNRRLDEFTREADGLGRRIVELNSKRLELKIELEDKLRELTLTPR